MSKKVVLIVEDSKDISDLIALYLADIPEAVILQAESGEAALSIFTNRDVDLIILDITLPYMNGYSVMQKVREAKDTPIIIVSSKTQDAEKILGLNLGADDYISKPFNPLELLARVKAQLRRSHSSEKGNDIDGIIRIGGIELNTDTCSLCINSERIDLTYTEYNLLKYFMESPRRVFTKRQLYAAVWKEEAAYYDNTIMVYISKLREKIEHDPKNPKYIITVRGLGYKFEAQ